MKEPRYCDIL
jgi:pterin-4a-carbinolamine dehydratase